MIELESVSGSLEEKVLNYTSISKSLNSKAKGILEAIEGMKKRAENLLKGAERLENDIKSEMEKCDKKKIENEFHSLTLIQNNPRVEISNKELLPNQYWRHKVKETIEPDTAAISKALKENIQIPGAYLVRDMRLAIR